MGYNRYSNDSFALYSTRRLKNASGDRLSVSETFNTTKANKDYLPTNITVRESFDSELNPESVPIILGIDFTASMGYVAHEMVNEYVPSLMSKIIDGGVKDPHLMAMAIRDYKASPSTPLQVSQFEGDHAVVEQMQDFYAPSSGGGGNGEESYALTWAFAALKTNIDCYNKRGKKGYLFTIGDDGPQTGRLNDYEMQELIGAGEAMTVEEIQALANEKYHLFHIHLPRGYKEERIEKRWKAVLGNRALILDDYTKVPELVMATISINEGADPNLFCENESVRKALGL